MSWCTISPEEDDWWPALSVSSEPNMKKQWTLFISAEFLPHANMLEIHSGRRKTIKGFFFSGRGVWTSMNWMRTLNLDAYFLLSRISHDLDEDYFFKHGRSGVSWCRRSKRAKRKIQILYSSRLSGLCKKQVAQSEGCWRPQLSEMVGGQGTEQSNA